MELDGDALWIVDRYAGEAISMPILK